ncbi:indole-3-glycerol phosphate synthase [Desulfotomaculum arcticum]|uniref:Indole-3-glycerol phosphate synthase n=1 Tax=Desulfotruncus arcticus DSM 17038 TaxID=1121424 RepID=A0A1I2Q8S9_9FIRM|nr:indole-3-glycerol phosphate synthase TrpC [Desulfotruncus arcticus]SFG24764.1 indole-3-glycerol phosphate synthase [Desulfotomaculum arcticum] [Desulfotruncus arcticus DSM 17038]
MSENILEKILRHKREEVADSRKRLPLEKLKEWVAEVPFAPVGFGPALQHPGEVALIAEVKRRSPSRGIIIKDFNLMETIAAYREAEADAVSVLTEREFFGGAAEYLAAARLMTRQPLLRKDFIIDLYQIYESRFLGADALLLIAGALADEELGEFIETTRALGMEALVETRTPDEIERAIAAKASIIGINNRDLRSFQVDLKTTRELIGYINKPHFTVVSESGIKNRTDVETLGSYGADAILVGESLMTSGDLQDGVRRFKGVGKAMKVAVV